ncbi:MAG TPA: hypothetical protein VMM92_14810 [Thermoanaerobaculia bacterium]|nr:hypothetical protein [Thermoanaerobaculia bacterium]
MPARPRREPYAAGDGLTRYPPGSAVALRIDAPWEKPWKARLPGGATVAAFPGTAILFEGALYEVIGAEAQAVGGESLYLYRLRPWTEESPPRQVVSYSVEECQRAARERAEQLRRVRWGRGLSWLSPLVGLLPAVDQRRIERDYNVSATRATLLSSLVLLGPSLLAAVRGIAVLMGRVVERGLPWDTWLPLSSYLTAESLARLSAAGYAGEPIGSLFVALPVAVFRTVEQSLRERQKPRPASSQLSSEFLLHEACDEVTFLPDGRLEISSFLPKPHWRLGHGVHYEERWYRLEEREEIAGAQGRRHRFLLTEEPEAHLLRSAVEYRPQEVRELHRQALLHKKQTWVETFAPFWGLTEAGLQRRLAELYPSYAAARHTAWSAVAMGLLRPSTPSSHCAISPLTAVARPTSSLSSLPSIFLAKVCNGCDAPGKESPQAAFSAGCFGPSSGAWSSWSEVSSSG